jgi:glycosyltransferase involved in cell wall biosynthesis
MTLGYFAPLPPSPSGVADYAATMLEAFSARGAVRVNAPGDLSLYHIGNNRLHAAIYQRALREPGVVLLHDALLHHLLLGLLEEDAYLAEFTANYGPWTLDLARHLWNGRAQAMSNPLYFRYPLLRSLSRASLGMVVHSAAAASAVRAHCPDAAILEIPHLNLEDPARSPSAAERESFRRDHLGVARGEFLLGVYGHLRETKRLASILAALDAIRALGVPAKLLIAGAFASDDYGRALGPVLRTHAAVILRGPSSADAFRLLLTAADVCVNLRYPSAGESSGIAVRAMALGVPLIVSEGMEADAGPPGTVVPVQTGPAEVPALVETLEWLAQDPRARAAIAGRAQAHCLETRDPARVCARLREWIESLAGQQIRGAVLPGTPAATA